MSKYDFIRYGKHFAIIPVKTMDEGWVWFKTVYKYIAKRPEEYSGLFHYVSYSVKPMSTDDLIG